MCQRIIIVKEVRGREWAGNKGDRGESTEGSRGLEYPGFRREPHWLGHRRVLVGKAAENCTHSSVGRGSVEREMV